MLSDHHLATVLEFLSSILTFRTQDEQIYVKAIYIGEFEWILSIVLPTSNS